MIIKKNYLAFDPILLKIGRGLVYLNRDAELDSMQLDLRKFPLETLTYFFPGFDARGRVSLKGDLRNLTENVTGTITARSSNLRVEDFHDRKHYSGTLEVNLNSSNLSLEAFLGRDKKDFSKTSLTLPLKLYPLEWKYELDRDAKIKGSVSYQGTINPFIQLLIPPNHLIEGKAWVDMKFGGSIKEPQIQGALSLENAYYENLYLGLVLKDTNLKMRAKGKKTHLR